MANIHALLLSYKLTRVDPDEAWNQAVVRAKVGLQRSIRGIEEDYERSTNDHIFRIKYCAIYFYCDC